MRLLRTSYTVTATLLLGLSTSAFAQIPQNPAAPAADTTHKYENPKGVSTVAGNPWYKGKLVKASIVPALLIGYGAYTFNGGGFYTNQEANRDIHKVFPTYRTHLDNLLIFAPYAELGLVALAGVESHNDRLNTLLVIGKSELIMLASTYAVKFVSHETRPDGTDNLSFPSGHTAQAFLAASIVHNEFRDKSQWYGIGAYTLASSVAVLRMVNSKHWQSDVVAGAGFGILSAHLAYLTHRNRWGRKPQLTGFHMAPTYFGGGAPGVSLSWRAH
jgi:membrane-associated phospholipid phosphatase